MSASDRNARQVIACIRHNGLPMTYAELVEVLPISLQTIRRAVTRAARRGQLEIIKVDSMRCLYIKVVDP